MSIASSVASVFTVVARISVGWSRTLTMAEGLSSAILSGGASSPGSSLVSSSISTMVEGPSLLLKAITTVYFLDIML